MILLCQTTIPKPEDSRTKNSTGLRNSKQNFYEVYTVVWCSYSLSLPSQGSASDSLPKVLGTNYF